MNIRQILRYEVPYLSGTPKAEWAVFIMAGQISDREKYGGILQNPPHYPGRLFTSDQPFIFKIQKITNI